MSAKLLALLNWIVSVVGKMLAGDTLNASQHETLNHILGEVREMLKTLMSLPDVREEEIRHELIYETRSRLTTVIGYSEMLLEEGDLVASDQETIEEIHDTGHQILDELTAMLT